MIVLASTSPRRLAILRSHGVEPVVISPQIRELLPEVRSAAEVEHAVCAVALAKAQDVWSRIQQGALLETLPGASSETPSGTPPGVQTALWPGAQASYLIAADTVVFKDRILGKPSNVREAFEMLELLRNTSHQVFTGVALICIETGAETSFCEVSTVTFGDYSHAEIKEYIHTEKPFDKAGAYAIQSDWVAGIAHVDGDRENVIGLPWYRIARYVSDTSESLSDCRS